MRKFLLYTILLTSLYTLNSFAQFYGWIYIGKNIPGDPLFYDLSNVYFINNNKGWITSSSQAEMYHTTDEGINWFAEGAGLTSSFLRGVHFTSLTNGYVVGMIKPY